ncbi:MAG: carbohydrate binding family 9 domain-containing protein [Ignavibacteriales bacterium]|nr:carbohydrate binding family 9 domain-containing protein [Ignavibacteriales bacterium]
MRKISAVALFSGILSSWAFSQNGNETVSPSSTTRSHHASRLERASVTIDGIIDEEAWQRTSAANNFVQMRPNEGSPATQATDVRVLYDNDALYVAARMYDNPDSIIGELFRRDGDVLSDWFYVQIDSYFDRRTAFSFAVNPAGVKKDILISNDTQEDISWDAVWESSVGRDEKGWTAEFRIPFSQLRFSESAGELTWGVNFQRRIARNGEYSFWSPVPGDVGSYVGRFGTLTGIKGLSAPARFEVQPYVVSRLKRSPERNAGSPYYRSNDFFGNTGADFKYGVTSDFTLSGTINPDFGQVEVDPAVVNLSAFEIFFPERRPFFVEGSEIFSFGRTRNYNSYGGGQYFYSRRIGRQPQRGIGAAFVDVPDQTTILGAAKLSGKTSSGLSVGVLDAVTQRESARYIDGSGVEQTAEVEPLTNYLVARVKKDFDGQTFVGGLLTSVNRDLKDPAFQSLLHTSATTGGVDFEHRWGGRNWLLGGFIAGSRVSGDRTVVERTQRSSARYFQRPDADYLEVDANTTSLNGYAGEATLMKVGGGNWIGSLTYQEFSPGLELNDMGFASLADRRAFSTYAEYQDRTPGQTFRNYGIYAYSNHAWTFGGDRMFEIYSGGAYANLLTFWNLSAYGYWGPDVLSDKLTRGGPLMTVVGQYGTGFNVQTDSREKIVVGLGVFYRGDYSGEYDKYISFNVNLRPTAALQIQFSPQLGYERDTDIFITSVSDSLATATFGRRYVFADVGLTNLSLNTRVNWAFTPDLSLQFVIQPFIQVRNFSFFKEFLQPRTYDFAVYGRDKGTLAYDPATFQYTADPDGNGPAGTFTFGSGFGQDDFSFRSVRANLVLRWEYLPGSTIFVVWQHLRSHVGYVSDFQFGRDAGDLLREPADNIFLIKLSYWFGR